MNIKPGDKVKLKPSLSNGSLYSGNVLSISEDKPHYSGNTYPIAEVVFPDATRRIMLKNLIRIG